jgi:UDP-N-acetylmuramoyl-tripeptide--D-alanyl-D-alanine ligase
VARENGAVIEVLGPCGMAVFPANDEYSQLWKGLCAGRPFMTFVDSLEAFDTADVRGEGQWEDGAWTVQASTPGGDMAFRLAIAGRHNVRNALAAVACALAAGVPLVDVRLGLEAFQPVKGRSRAISVILAGRSITVVDDTYNANPDSVKAAIDVLAELPGPRLLVLGDMGEVGDQGSKFHSEVGAYASECGVDRLFTLGALSAFATPHVEKGRHFEDISSLIGAVLLALPTFASVVVKGSRFMKMERVVDAITRYAAEQQEGLNHAA